jgi:hypothetical protein
VKEVSGSAFGSGYVTLPKIVLRRLGRCRSGLALKNPPKKTHPKKPTKSGFFKFLIFYENNKNFSLSNRFFMNK